MIGPAGVAPRTEGVDVSKSGKRVPPAQPAKRKVLIVDDHPIIRQGLGKLVNDQNDLETCAEAQNIGEALTILAECDVQIAVVDLSLGSESGLELIKSIKAHKPDLPVLVLSMHDESIYAERAMRAGAMGYIMKSESFDRILEAIRRVLNGEISVSNDLAAKMLQSYVRGGGSASDCPSDLLSDRELEVFTLVGRGLATRQIAHAMHLSVKTVETYREKIKAKLGLNAVELTHHAFQWTQQQDSPPH